MFVPVRYTIYGWSPPELSPSERIWLGEEIAKVGRKAFVTALKQKLSAPARAPNTRSFTFSEIITDAKRLRDEKRARPGPPMWAVAVTLLFFGGCFWIIASNPRLLVSLLVTMAIVAPISIGSLLWMYNKVDRWAQSFIDEYADSVANRKSEPSKGQGAEQPTRPTREYSSPTIPKVADSAETARVRRIAQQGDASAQSAGTVKPEGRGRITLSEGRAKIELFKSADASTFMHLTAHHWLDMLVRAAGRQDAPAEIKADLKAFLDWVGIKSANDIRTEMHEHWARGFEQYLMEGNAPSLALEPQFALFRTELLAIYGSPSVLGKPITNEIREVFDRLLASDEEISSQRRRLAGRKAAD